MISEKSIRFRLPAHTLLELETLQGREGLGRSAMLRVLIRREYTRRERSSQPNTTTTKGRHHG